MVFVLNYPSIQSDIRVFIRFMIIHDHKNSSAVITGYRYTIDDTNAGHENREENENTKKKQRSNGETNMCCHMPREFRYTIYCLPNTSSKANNFVALSLSWRSNSFHSFRTSSST